MNRTLSLDDYVTLANSILQEKNPNAVLRPATLQDATGIQDLTHFDKIDYQLRGITAILSEPDNFNYVIAANQTPHSKNREPGGYQPQNILSFSLAYPAQQFPKILGHMPWTPSETPPEHNDPRALWLELKITHPDLRGNGIYKVIRTMQELATYQAGYDKIFLQSFSDKARDIHAKEGYQLLRTVGITEPGYPYHDEYLMRLDLTQQRHKRNKEYLETARIHPTILPPTDTPSSYAFS